MVRNLFWTLILLPFQFLDAILSAFLHPKRISEREEESIANLKMKKMKYMIHLQADQIVFQQHQLKEMDRLHQLEMDQLEVKHRSIIRDLQREHYFERMRKASQH